MRGSYFILIFDGVECLGTVFGSHDKTMYFIRKEHAFAYIKEILDGDFNRYKVRKEQ